MNYCPNCGTKIEGKYCTHCGAEIDKDKVIIKKEGNNKTSYIPYMPQYKPLSPWGYVGYYLLFSIPIIGFILMIVYALSDDNINRRNFARSFFCIFLLVIIIIIVLFALLVMLGIATNR